MNAISNLTPVDRDAVLEWLRESAQDALIHEPEVGLFANERMAAAFDELAAIVETASAIEAASAGETTKIGSTEGESATRKGDAHD